MSRRRFTHECWLTIISPERSLIYSFPLPAPQFATTTAEILTHLAPGEHKHSPAGNTQAFQAAWSVSHHQQSPARGNPQLHPQSSGMEMKPRMLWTPCASNIKRIFPKCQKMSLLNAQLTNVCHTQVLFMNIKSWGLIKAWVCSYKLGC